MAEQLNGFQNIPNKHREKFFSDEVKEADPDFNAPVAVYEFKGRTFKETKPYEPPK